jgi:hypothetical protein
LRRNIQETLDLFVRVEFAMGRSAVLRQDGKDRVEILVTNRSSNLTGRRIDKWITEAVSPWIRIGSYPGWRPRPRPYPGLISFVPSGQISWRLRGSAEAGACASIWKILSGLAGHLAAAGLRHSRAPVKNSRPFAQFVSRLHVRFLQ